MSNEPKESTKHHAKSIKIKIAPDQIKASFNETRIDPIGSHVFELPVASTVKHVKIEKDPVTGEVSIHLSE